MSIYCVTLQPRYNIIYIYIYIVSVLQSYYVAQFDTLTRPSLYINRNIYIYTYAYIYTYIYKQIYIKPCDRVKWSHDRLSFRLRDTQFSTSETEEEIYLPSVSLVIMGGIQGPLKPPQHHQALCGIEGFEGGGRGGLDDAERRVFLRFFIQFVGAIVLQDGGALERLNNVNTALATPRAECSRGKMLLHIFPIDLAPNVIAPDEASSEMECGYLNTRVLRIYYTQKYFLNLIK